MGPGCWLGAPRGPVEGGSAAKDTTPTPSRGDSAGSSPRPPGDTWATTVLPPEPSVRSTKDQTPELYTSDLQVLLQPLASQRNSVFFGGRHSHSPLRPQRWQIRVENDVSSAVPSPVQIQLCHFLLGDLG